MKSFLKALRSMRWAIYLISYLAVTGILATFVPQDQEAAAYTLQYGRLLGPIIVQTGFFRFFTSILFLIPCLLFFINLSLCTVHRLARELGKKGRSRHGPDILHLGLILLVIGAAVSFSLKKEGSVSLAVGEKVDLPDGRVLELLDFFFVAYEDGRPKDWTSTVRLSRNGSTECESYAIRVNHPLRIGWLSLYQYSHVISSTLVIKDPSGKEIFLQQGERATAGDAELFFMAADDGTGHMVLSVVSGVKNEVLRVAAGERAGPFSVVGMRSRDITGLHAVLDPGYPVILAALLVVVAGLFLTFIQKLGDMKP